MIKGVFLDMDNTLFDFVSAKLEACEGMVQYLEEGRAEELFGYFRRGVYDFEHPLNIRDYLCDRGLFTDETFGQCVSIYEEIKLDRIKPYPGIKATLRRLGDMGLRLAVVTDAHTESALSRLDKTGVLGMVDEVITCDMTEAKKPSRRVFSYALQTCGISAQNAAFVGDSIMRDMEPAGRIGMLTVHAAWGDRNDHENASYSPDFVLRDIRELPAILENPPG
jgi:putative hydrolase of the HAD superfamily